VTGVLGVALQRWKLVVAGVLGLLAVVVVPPAHAAGVGAVADITWGQPQSAVDREIELLRAAGVRWIRANVNWAFLESSRKGQIDAGLLAQYDYAVDRAHAAGLQVLIPISDGVPYWASADPEKYVDSGGAKHWNRFYPPAKMADYGDIVRFVVGHFQARGVHTFEIWNEPNHDWFWASGPDPAGYVEMLKAAYPVAKAADPTSTVLLGGLSKSDFEYLEGVYRAGGRGYFDAVAVHPYTYGVDPTVAWNGVNQGEDRGRLSKNSFPAIQEIKRTMDAHGDGQKQVWITEFGFSTTTGDGGVSEERQAEYLTKAFAYLERFPWVHSAFWYSARNNPFGGDRDEYEQRFGLMTSDWRLKPSYEALRAYATTPAGSDGRPPAAGPGPGATPGPAQGADPAKRAGPATIVQPPAVSPREGGLQSRRALRARVRRIWAGARFGPRSRPPRTGPGMLGKRLVLGLRMV
jgi:hypothetical protein